MKRHILKRITIIITAILLVSTGIACIKLIQFARYVEHQTGLTPLSLIHLLTDSGVQLHSTDERINILLLGIAGGAHEGGDLTDTIILVSLQLNKPTVTLLSIPRDIWSETLKDKANSAYHYGEKKKKGGGLVLSKAIIEEITGIPVHYTILVDFFRFEQLIDQIGGIDVNVLASFTDAEFPIAGKENDTCGGDLTYKCRYVTVRFEEGIQHMDGRQALMYVRSRHAEGKEGTDFARSTRQQDMLIALKNKIMQMRPWFHPKLAVSLLTLFDEATETDMMVSEQLPVGKLALRITLGDIRKISIEPLFTMAPLWKYNRYVLIPLKDDQTLKALIKSSLEQTD